MMNFKKQHNQDGMSFIEVVLAVFIIGTSVTALLLLQGTSFSGLTTMGARLERIFLMKEYLSTKAFDRAKKEKGTNQSPQKKTINEPKTTITYELKKPSRESSLKEQEHIKIEQCTAEWDEFATKMQETMITFLFKPEPKKS
jgi:hypothetical protein